MRNHTSRQRTTRLWLAIIAALAVGAASIAGIALWSGPEERGVPGDPGVLAEAYAKRIGLRLPLGAQAEFADWMTGLDDAARLILLMPEAAWPAFRADLPGLSAARPFEAETNYVLGMDEGRWAPGRAAGLLSVQLPWRGGLEVMNLGIAPAHQGWVRVFVFWHQL